MIRPALGTALILSLVYATGSPAQAKDFNTKRPYLPPTGQVKVNNARASLFVLQGQVESDAKKAEETGAKVGERACPDGVFVDRSNPRREVIIATKDIINLGGQLDLSASCR
jgi:hypothetical protein